MTTPVRIALFVVSALSMLCFAMAVLSGCTAQQVQRIVQNDYGWCRDNGECGDREARWTATVDCMREIEPVVKEYERSHVFLPPPLVVRHDPDSSVWWLGTCSWLECRAYKSGLCKGYYHGWEVPPTVYLPTGDDKALGHEFVHHILWLSMGDSNPGKSHSHAGFMACGFPMLCCP